MDKIYLVTLYTQDDYGFQTYHVYKRLAFDATKYTRKILKPLALKIAVDANIKMNYPHVYTTRCDIELLKITN